MGIIIIISNYTSQHFQLFFGRAGKTLFNTMYMYKIFKFSKISGMIDMMSPMKSANGEDVFLCLWAGPGLFKSTFFAILMAKISVGDGVVLAHFWPEEGHIWNLSSLSIYWFGVLVPWVLEEVAKMAKMPWENFIFLCMYGDLSWSWCNWYHDAFLRNMECVICHKSLQENFTILISTATCSILH